MGLGFHLVRRDDSPGALWVNLALLAVSFLAASVAAVLVLAGVVSLASGK